MAHEKVKQHLVGKEVKRMGGVIAAIVIVIELGVIPFIADRLQ